MNSFSLEGMALHLKACSILVVCISNVTIACTSHHDNQTHPTGFWTILPMVGIFGNYCIKHNFYHSTAYALILHTARIFRKELYVGEQGELGIRCLIPRLPYNKLSPQKLIRKKGQQVWASVFFCRCEISRHVYFLRFLKHIFSIFKPLGLY